MPPLLLGVVEVVVVIIGWCRDWGVIVVVKRRGVGLPPSLDDAGGGNDWIVSGVGDVVREAYRCRCHRVVVVSGGDGGGRRRRGR